MFDVRLARQRQRHVGAPCHLSVQPRGEPPDHFLCPRRSLALKRTVLFKLSLSVVTSWWLLSPKRKRHVSQRPDINGATLHTLT